jgi:thioredoxin
MKRIYFMLLSAAFLLGQCTSETKSSNGFLLSPAAFSQKIIEYPAAPIIDVRSAGEFARVHLQNAVNLDMNGELFNKGISTLDKSRPLFVYCLSGSRSSTAAERLRAMGFTTVYELEGGLMKWRSADLPVMTNDFSTPGGKTNGMTKAEFEHKLSAEKLVLVDFYADWCAPCRKMRPAIDEIALEMKDKVDVMTIDADAHPQLCKDLDVVSLPTLLLYKNKVLAWENRGYLEKAAIIKALQ